MKKLRINYYRLGAILLIAAALAAECYLRFSNPALTETQLFLRFWHIRVLTAIGAVGAGLFWNRV